MTTCTMTLIFLGTKVFLGKNHTLRHTKDFQSIAHTAVVISFINLDDTATFLLLIQIHCATLPQHIRQPTRACRNLTLQRKHSTSYLHCAASHFGKIIATSLHFIILSLLLRRNRIARQSRHFETNVSCIVPNWKNRKSVTISEIPQKIRCRWRTKGGNAISAKIWT